MKIAFTSCFDAYEDPKQIVWDRVRAQAPEVLLLLGDTIYMDYFPRLGRPRKLSNQEFANEMYNRYKAQWGVESFRKLIASVKRVGLTWDDHDFAWNGSCGAGTNRKQSVPQEKRRISKNLFLQFKGWAQQKNITPEYPNQPSLDHLLTGDDTGIQDSFDYGPVRIIMLDGRTYREDPTDEKDDGQMPVRSLLGKTQRTWLENQVKASNGLKLLCSGSTLTRSGESWDHYMDYQWLMDKGFKKTIVLSGDIHKNATQLHGGYLFEITSSGAALPRIGGGSGNFGILETEGGPVKITLYEEDGLDKTKTLPL
ncbi:MAG: alkaline phosphatase D family protein [Candidatus Contendobacter sp.]|nr:alkaline phosphatase D family protein [Candidatus Contendobacter sp.]MDG4555867.1 alkaline phosphatase D family protein [Candidatus Contendobacter sp.]